MSTPSYKSGDRVRYYPGGRDRESYLGTVRTAPWQLGGGQWVVHLHEMEATYKRGECSIVYAAACDALDLVDSSRQPPPYVDLDPGIRETVRWLFEAGFEPCDSGDGVSKFDGAIEDDHDPNMFLHVPNVALIVSPDRLVQETDRLCGMLAGRGVVIEATGPGEGQPSIQATYDPGRPQDAVIMLIGVDDARLGLGRGDP